MNERLRQCITNEPGDRSVLCGRKRQEVGGAWKRWVQAHIDGYGASDWCPECFALWQVLPADERTPPPPSWVPEMETLF